MRLLTNTISWVLLSTNFAPGRAYVLSRFAMRLYAPVRTYDELTVNTWACPGTGVVFYRCGSIDRGDERIAELSTTWAMLDTATRAFVKQSDVSTGSVPTNR